MSIDTNILQSVIRSLEYKALMTQILYSAGCNYTAICNNKY